MPFKMIFSFRNNFLLEIFLLIRQIITYVFFKLIISNGQYFYFQLPFSFSWQNLVDRFRDCGRKECLFSQILVCFWSNVMGRDSMKCSHVTIVKTNITLTEPRNGISDSHISAEKSDISECLYLGGVSS